MFGEMDREDDTRSHKNKDRKREFRRKLPNDLKLSEWKKKMGSTIGTHTIPKDITLLSCGCSQPVESKKVVGLRLTRVSDKEEWKHFECSKVEKGHT